MTLLISLTFHSPNHRNVIGRVRASGCEGSDVQIRSGHLHAATEEFLDVSCESDVLHRFGCLVSVFLSRAFLFFWSWLLGAWRFSLAFRMGRWGWLLAFVARASALTTFYLLLRLSFPS